MSIELRICTACNGDRANWNPLCGGCGGHLLICEHDGERFAGPYSEKQACVVPWDHLPTAEEREAAEVDLALVIVRYDAEKARV